MKTFAARLKAAHFRRILLLLLFVGLPLVRGAGTEDVFLPPPPVRFVAMDVEMDAGATPLAAYQIELNTGTAELVGIEGGEPAPFRDAPFYDPHALRQNRVILAAFTLAPAAQLPHGRTRIARLHLEVPGAGGRAGAPDVTVKKVLATDAQGNSIPATVRFEPSAAN